MASRSRKTASAGMETPNPKVTAGPSPPGPRSSPLSPHRISRVQEKLDLANLNDRLAAYIDRVRYLEKENSRLGGEVKTIEESMTKEIRQTKVMFEHELGDTRKLLDDTSKEKAKLQIDLGKACSEGEELRNKLKKKDADYNAAAKALGTTEGHLRDITSRLNAAEAENKKMMADLKDMREEQTRVGRQLAEAKKQLESETLMRVDLENRNQSLKEELQFKTSMFDQKITEITQRKQQEISEIDGELVAQYEARAQEDMQRMREEWEGRLEDNREEMEKKYEPRMKDLEQQNGDLRHAHDQIKSQLNTAKRQVQSFQTEQLLHETALQNLKAQLADSEKEQNRQREDHDAELARLKAEMVILRETINTQLQEYQTLMEVKISLDNEIAAYRRLLEGEEMRLNMTPTPRSGSSLGRVVSRGETPRTPIRGMKRKRTIFEEDNVHRRVVSSNRSVGPLEIIDDCQDGKFVKFHNKSDEDMSLGGFLLIRRIGNEDVNVHKFSARAKIPANSEVTVWSSTAGVAAKSPLTVVMAKDNVWRVADNMTTVLLNSEGEEMAARISVKEMEERAMSREEGDGGGHQRSPREQCCIM